MKHGSSTLVAKSKYSKDRARRVGKRERHVKRQNRTRVILNSNSI